MKIKVVPILHRAIYEGVDAGLTTALEESKKPENASNHDIIKDVVSLVVLQNILAILDLDDEVVELQKNVAVQPE